MPRENDKPCPKCVADIGMGFLFKVCRESLSGEVDCKDLRERFMRGEITEDDVAKKLKDVARGNAELLEDLEEIDRIRKTRRIDP